MEYVKYHSQALVWTMAFSERTHPSVLLIHCPLMVGELTQRISDQARGMLNYFLTHERRRLRKSVRSSSPTNLLGWMDRAFVSQATKSDALLMRPYILSKLGNKNASLLLFPNSKRADRFYCPFIEAVEWRVRSIEGEEYPREVNF